MSDKPDLRLPGASVSSPTCGACHEETSYEDGDFYCEGCRLGYSGADPESPGYYLDDEDETCGAPPPKPPYVSEYKDTGRFYLHTYYPCPLPKDHKDTGLWWDNQHYHPSDAKECPKPADHDTPEGLRV